MAVIVLLTSCSGEETPETVTVEPEPLRAVQTVEVKPPEEIPETEELPWTEDEVNAIAITLAGECYDDKPHDKRLVCEVILNRVSSADFPNTVIDVVSAPHQFTGYWNQSREVSSDDIEIATQALRDWYNNGCKPLSEYLFFSAGENRENEFRKEF